MDEGLVITYHSTMIGFLIKKTFFDLWDNMFRVALLNLGFLASLLIPLLPALLPGVFTHAGISLALTAAGILWCSVYLAAASLSLKAVSDYGAFGFGDFFRNIGAALKPGLCMGGAVFVLVTAARAAIPFYLRMNPPLLGLFLAAVVFWVIVLSVFSLQWFFPIRARLDKKILKVFKKCFIIFFDNAGFSVFSLLHNMILGVLSGFLAFLVPGPAGILLFLDEAMRLRLMKYDWLEANPDPSGSHKRRKIPWDVILIEEREKTGSRSLRNFIFPWKD